ncbi:ABC transporter permease [Methanobacterium alcaliphilum]|uniref:ABC transporter permease n=1 Tax=Methanobacterium alcaliphilum TaxID=392018 RepID=UPI00200B2F4A|nr:ABC transporter permease [Methanobacterium alcaliphilum]MCK9151091.1 ABC transporter permease subunit [Methanobacterium alcaliphilum]
MGSWIITKWELKNTLSSKKFLIIFFFQLAVLLLMIMFFNNFMASVESEEGISLTPSLNQFASLDVYDPEKSFIRYLNPEILEITQTDGKESSLVYESHKTGYLSVNASDPLSLNLENLKPIQANLFLDYSDPKRSVVKDEVELAGNKSATRISQQLIASLSPQEDVDVPQVKQEAQGESLPLQLINKVMTAILLFLPLFLFGNLVVDSIVGEKERKTGEILIAMPISRSYIILGKSMAVIITMALQVALWMIVMLMAGFSLKNPFLIYLIVVITAVPIVGLTAIIAAFAKNYKEAGIGITFAYIAIIGFLIVPALAYISQQGRNVSLSTMTLIIKIFSGETLTLGDIVVPLIFITIISFVSFSIAIWLFRRDDIVFGPRPNLFYLIFELMGINKLIKLFKGNE